jgi:Leucine-rich repeat (LRR) protein
MLSLAVSAATAAAIPAGDGIDVAALAKASAAKLRIDYQHLAEIAYKGGLVQGQLPDTVQQRSSLLALGLQRTGMSHFPALNHLQLLVALDISCNFLMMLPASISELQRLEIIDCSDNKLKELPPSLFMLTKLTKLIAYKNSISRLDEAVNQLTQLEEINL